MYVEVSPGLSMISDSDTSGGFFAFPDIEYDRGFTIGGALGYQIQDQVRAEASLSYRTADVDQVGGISAGASGDVNVTSLMANVYYDFDLGLPVTPYLGAGLGLARVDLDDRKIDLELVESQPPRKSSSGKKAAKNPGGNGGKKAGKKGGKKAGKKGRGRTGHRRHY